MSGTGAMTQRMIAALAVVIVLAGMASARAASWRSHAGGYEYAFEAQTGGANKWNSKEADHPSLSPKRAIEIAVDFMRAVPPIGDGYAWAAHDVGLAQVGRGADEWVYVVTFWPGPRESVKTREGSFAPLHVVIDLDGKIAPFKKSAHKERRKGSGVRH